MDSRPSIDRILTGALAGVAGGSVMAAMMRKVAPRILPERMRPEEFVPKKAVEWAEEQVGRPDALSEATEMKAGMAAHLGYSAVLGAAYGVARPFSRRLPAPVAGALYGAMTWVVGFEGFMPALGVMERTTEKPPVKWPAPIMAHMIYGAATALTFDALERLEGDRRRTRRRQTTAAEQLDQPRDDRGEIRTMGGSYDYQRQ